MTDWVVVPVKSIANGKSRLAPILGRPRRQRLNRALLCRTLELARALVGDRVVVVSHCAETKTIAEAFGAHVLREPRAVGLNRALGLARDHAVAHGARGLLVLPSDLPLATLPDLRRLRRIGGHRGSVVICRDRHGQGTNALYLNRPSKFRFCFGPDSAAAHVEEAHRCALSAITAEPARLAFDLDTPEDYRDLNRAGLTARRFRLARAALAPAARARPR